MRDLAGAVARRLAPVSRRQLVGAVAGGSLLGSAWAVAFRDAVVANGATTATIVRADASLGVLIDHCGHRILILDTPESQGAEHIASQATGFLRQRIDVVLIPASTASNVTSALRERWRVRETWLIPDGSATSPQSLAGKSLRLGELRIDAGELPLDAWRYDAPFLMPWRVAVTLGRSCLTIVPTAMATQRLSLEASHTNVIVCGDTSLSPAALPASTTGLAAPVELGDDVPEGIQFIPLRTGAPVTLTLRADSIEVRATG